MWLTSALITVFCCWSTCQRQQAREPVNTSSPTVGDDSPLGCRERAYSSLWSWMEQLANTPELLLMYLDISVFSQSGAYAVCMCVCVRMKA